ncbi:MAG: hypothetical protein GY816_07780 [Cytophagales bacterium]|nr:hypothetical protein [Cytophagales bacterium]
MRNGIIISLCFYLSIPFLVAQPKYFEYTNPNALEVNQSVISHLVKKEWEMDSLIYLYREGQDTLMGGGSLNFMPNGQFGVNEKWS